MESTRNFDGYIRAFVEELVDEKVETILKKYNAVKPMKYYTVSEVAKITGLTADHIYRLTKSGELGSYKIGRKVLISQEQLDEWLASKRIYTKHERTIIADTYVATH